MSIYEDALQQEKDYIKKVTEDYLKSLKEEESQALKKRKRIVPQKKEE